MLIWSSIRVGKPQKRGGGGGDGAVLIVIQRQREPDGWGLVGEITRSVTGSLKLTVQTLGNHVHLLKTRVPLSHHVCHLAQSKSSTCTIRISKKKNLIFMLIIFYFLIFIFSQLKKYYTQYFLINTLNNIKKKLYQLKALHLHKFYLCFKL